MFSDEKTNFRAPSNQISDSSEGFSDEKTSLQELRKLFFQTAKEVLHLASDLQGHKSQRNIAQERGGIILDNETTSSEDIIARLSFQIRNKYKDLLSIQDQLRKLSEIAIDQAIKSKIDKVKNVIIPLINSQ